MSVDELRLLAGWISAARRLARGAVKLRVRGGARFGAAIGREFSYELVAAGAHRDEADSRDALDQLVQVGLVLRRGMPPRASFMFKHALVQDAAYSSLLRSQRPERLRGGILGKLPPLMTSLPTAVEVVAAMAAVA